MRRFRSLPWMPLAALVLFMMVAPRRAEATSIKWTLNEVVFTDGGTASGYFYYDSAAEDVYGFDVTTTQGLLLDGHHYLDPNGDAPPYPKSGFAVLDLPLPKDLTGVRFLALIFSPALYNSPGKVSLTTSSGEGFCVDVACAYGNYVRTVKSGSLVGTVPEPAALYLLGAGLITVFLIRRKFSPNAR